MVGSLHPYAPPHHLTTSPPHHLTTSPGVSRSPAAPTLDDETERAAASPPPCGEGQGGGIAEHRRWRFPPPLAPPHKGEGDPRTARLWLHQRNPGAPDE